MSVFRDIYEDLLKQDKIRTLAEHNVVSFVEEDTYESAIVNSFVWGGADFEQQRPENYLYYRGLCGGFPENDKHIIYPAFPNGKLRGDGYYTHYTLISMDGKAYLKPFEDIVLLKNNPSLIPSHIIVKYYTDKLVSVLETIDNMLYRARWGNVFEGDPNAIALLKKIGNKVEVGQKLICVEGEGLMKDVQRLNIFDNRESDIISMWAIFEKYKNELLTTFGFNNVGYEKHERLLVDEVTANNDVILNGFFGSMVSCRKDFCKRYNERFGANLTCEVNRQDIITNKDKMSEEEPKEETPTQQEGGQE